MKIARRAGLGLAAGLLATAAFGQQQIATVPTAPKDLGIDPQRLERMTWAFQGWVDDGKLPGAVLLVSRYGEVVLFKSVGFRDREEKQPMTNEAIFRIASMTKPIVSVAALILAEEGKLDLVAPVAQYLPEFKDLKVRADRLDPATGRVEDVLEAPRRPMLVQDLLRHTAGLVYGPPIGRGPLAEAYREANMGSRDETLGEMITKMSKLPLAHHPGEVWEYSMATDVLGRVIEVVSGLELDRFLAERVTGPLGMTSTGFSVGPDKAGLIAQHQIDPATGKRPPQWDPLVKPRRLSGGGGLVSSAADYLRFAAMLMQGGAGPNGRLLSPATVQLMTSNALSPGVAVVPSRAVDISPTPAMGQGFGLGFAVRTENGQNPLPGTAGSYYWTGAFGTTFYVDPRQQLVSIMMIQSPSPENSFYRRAFRYLTYQALTRVD